MSESWQFVEAQFDPDVAKGHEGLFTLGSGYLHVRGSLEEHLHDAPQDIAYLRKPANVTAEAFPEMKVKWGTFVPGIYGIHPLIGKEMANLPYFLSLVPYVGGEKLDMERSRVENYRRALSFRDATLTRSLRWRTASGALVDVEFARFVSAARPHLCVQKAVFQSDRDVELEIRAGIDANVRTSGYDHFTSVTIERSGGGIACHVRLDSGDTIGLLMTVMDGEAPWRYESGERDASLLARFSLTAGQPLRLEKRTAVITSFDSEQRHLEALVSADHSYEALHDEHAAIWHERWRKSDVVIEGDDESQVRLRMGLYHLLRAHPNDERLAIDPKAYAGDAYRGLYFWDTEMYMLPFFLYTDPPRAKSLLNFRLNTLPGARANAASYGYGGARYPWEGDTEGIDHCPNWQYRDHEVHVTADVVYGLAHYARATGDRDFLYRHSAEVLRQTALFWRERVDWRPDDPFPSLLGVMGPDEYAPITNNNAYTNRLVALALHLAAEVEPEESLRAEFRRIADLLPILRRGDLVLQCEEFDHYAEVDFDALWQDRLKPFAAQVSQEKLYRSKALKQADVLLLMMLFPDEFTREEVQAAWTYYVPYTTHDSSLSPGVHAIVAARLGRMEEAWRFWRQSLAIDMGRGAAEGIHIAAQGINWQMATLGFGGMLTAMNTDRLTLAPRLPPGWTRLMFPIEWRGQRVLVDASPTRVIVENQDDSPITVVIYGAEKTVEAASEGTFPVPDAAGWQAHDAGR